MQAMKYLITVSSSSLLNSECVLIEVEPDTALQVFEQILQKKPISST